MEDVFMVLVEHVDSVLEAALDYSHCPVVDAAPESGVIPVQENTGSQPGLRQ